jgi:hypothetical protein
MIGLFGRRTNEREYKVRTDFKDLTLAGPCIIIHYTILMLHYTTLMLHYTTLMLHQIFKMNSNKLTNQMQQFYKLIT